MRPTPRNLNLVLPCRCSRTPKVISNDLAPTTFNIPWCYQIAWTRSLAASKHHTIASSEQPRMEGHAHPTKMGRPSNQNEPTCQNGRPGRFVLRVVLGFRGKMPKDQLRSTCRPIRSAKRTQSSPAVSQKNQTSPGNRQNEPNPAVSRKTKTNPIRPFLKKPNEPNSARFLNDETNPMAELARQKLF